MPLTIEDLRNALFETLQDVKNKDKPGDLERAKVVCEVAAKIIDTAKVEVAFINASGGKGSGFIPDGTPRLTAGPGAPLALGQRGRQ